MGADIFNGYNFYDVLGVSKNATNEEIDKAHRLFVSMYHSDKTGLGDEPVKLANHAKDVLKDPVKRAKHDKDIADNKQNDDRLIELENKIRELEYKLSQENKLNSIKEKTINILKKLNEEKQ